MDRPEPMRGEYREGWERDVAAAQVRAAGARRGWQDELELREKAPYGSRLHFLAEMVVLMRQLQRLDLWSRRAGDWRKILAVGLEALAAVVVLLLTMIGPAHAQEGVCSAPMTLHDKACPAGTSCTNLNDSRLLTAAEADNGFANIAQLCDFTESPMLTAGSDGDSSTAQSDSGLEVVGGKLTILRGCADNEILKWDETQDDWNCEPDTGTAAPAGATTEVQLNLAGVFATDPLFVFKDATNRLGIGTASPDASVHILAGGTTLVGTTEGDLIIQDDATTAGQAELLISGGTAGQSNVWFGDTDNETRGRVTYSHATDTMTIGAGGVAHLTIDATGQMEGSTGSALALGISGAATATLDVRGDVLIDGFADEVQLRVQGNATQTVNTFVVEQSDGTDKFWVNNDGSTTIDTELTTDLFTIKGGYNPAGDEGAFDFAICDQDDSGRCIGMGFGTDEEELFLGAHDSLGNHCPVLKLSAETGQISVEDDGTCGGGTASGAFMRGQQDATAAVSVGPNKNFDTVGMGGESKRLEFYAGTTGAGGENMAITSDGYGGSGTILRYRRATAAPTSNPEANTVAFWYLEGSPDAFYYRDDTGTEHQILSDQHQNAGTDITADLEEETHAAEHAENAADELLAEDLGTACADGEVLKANATGGLVCGTDNTGAGGGDAIEIEDGDNASTFTAIDTTARFDDSGDINFTFADGGAGGPDVVTATVRADSVALATDTTGAYVATLSAGTNATLSITGSGGENAAVTAGLNFSDPGADPALGANAGRFSPSGFVWEGSVADTIEARFSITNPTSSDKTHTFPDANTVTVQGQTCTGTDKFSALSGTTGALTCSADDDTAETDAKVTDAHSHDGTATGTTAAADDNDTSLATTAFVQQEINGAGGTGLTCASGQCNVDLGTSISSAEIEADTIVAADVDASLDTRSSQILWEDVDPADEFVLFLPPVTGTMTRIDCRAVGGTSFTIKVCDGVDVGDDTCTTNILDATEATTLTCTTSGASDTALNAAGFVARDPVTVVVTAESGVVDQAIVYITSTVD